MLELSGFLVTLDAIGCRMDIAKQIAALQSRSWLLAGIVSFFPDFLSVKFVRGLIILQRMKRDRAGRNETRLRNILFRSPQSTQAVITRNVIARSFVASACEVTR